MAIPGGHRVQLDGLRAIAVLLVAFGHWFGTEHFDHELPWPYIGVELFFVLSGYLITGILLNTRVRAEASGASLRPVVAAFFSRRLLRLVPALYLYLVAASVLGLFGDTDGWFWYATYLGNYRMADLGHGPAGAYHLWSLAVEEQFYLVVPFIVLLTRRMTVLRLLAMLTAGSIATLVLSQRMELTTILPPAAFPGLFGGCLLAAAAHRGLARSQLVNRLGVASGALYLSYRIVSRSLDIHFWAVPTEAFLVVALCSVVWSAARGESKFGRIVLENRVLRWLGSVSYGFYLWHVLAPALVDRYAPDLVGGRPMTVQFVVLVVATLIPTTASYYLLERPCISLKRFVPYLKPVPDRRPDSELVVSAV